MVASNDRAQVLGFRVRAQQLDRERGTLASTAVLDIGAQDTGPDGALWALAIRGVDVSRLPDRALALAWTVRGAPHMYRRGDLPAVAAAVEPYSDADAGKRIFDAAKPLRAAGIGNLEALDAVAVAMRSIVTKPMVKGEVSTRLTAAMGEPFVRYCRACQATHLYEMPFRISALRAGLELQPGTSPPVLEPVTGFRRASTAGRRFDLVRAYLRLLGPAAPQHVAAYLDAPVKDVSAHWPSDVVEVIVDGETRSVLSEDAARIGAGPARGTRLLGPYDLFLQLRDRPSLVDDPAKARALWPALGRPGALLHDSDVVGLWRPRKSGAKLGLRVELWTKPSPTLSAGITEQAERLAAFRGIRLGAVDVS